MYPPVYRKSGLIILLLALAGLAFVFADPFLDVLNDLVLSRRMGPKREFRVQSSFLTDLDALEAARKTLLLDGYDLDQWQAHEDRRTTAPDGSPDRFLVRNALNPNEGAIRFVRSAEGSVDVLDVIVEYDNQKISTYVWRPK